EAAASDQIDFRGMYYTLRERAWVIGLCLLIAALSTTAYVIRAPRIYEAKLVLQVEQEEQKILNIQRLQAEDPQSLEFLKTVEQTLQSPALCERVSDTNQLAGDPRFLASLDMSPPPTREQIITELSRMVDAKLRKGTRLIDVRAEHVNAEVAALIANSLYQEFTGQNFEYNSSTADNAYNFLRNEEVRLKSKLEDSERDMQAYKESTKSVSLEDRQNVVVEKLKELNQKVTESKSQRILSETSYEQARSLSNDAAALMFLPTVAADPGIADIRGNIARLESELANLRQRYKEKHPKYIQTASQLAEWKQTHTNAVLNIPRVIKALFESARTAEIALETALREQEEAALELNKRALHYNALAREVESDRALYDAVLNRIKETALTKDIRPGKVRVIQ